MHLPPISSAKRLRRLIVIINAVLAEDLMVAAGNWLSGQQRRTFSLSVWIRSCQNNARCRLVPSGGTDRKSHDSLQHFLMAVIWLPPDYNETQTPSQQRIVVLTYAATLVGGMQSLKVGAWSLASSPGLSWTYSQGNVIESIRIDDKLKDMDKHKPK